MVGNIKIYYYILLMANVIDDKVRDSKSVSKGKNINIIVATSTNYGIGYENKMCWNIPNELKYFKNITTTVNDIDKKNCVIMGHSYIMIF